jgi:hypothetical protein
MTHFRIIETSAHNDCPDILLVRDRSDDGDELVRIFACGIVDGEDNIFVHEEVTFDNPITASDFIECYTEGKAEAWCKRNNVKYW